MERWRWCPKSFHLCSLHLPSKHRKAEKTGQFVWKEATPIDRIFITVMFSCCSRGRVWSPDEWNINVHVLSLSLFLSVLSLWWCGSARMSLCAGFYPHQCHVSSEQLPFLSLEFPGSIRGLKWEKHMRKHCLSESATLLSYPSLSPLCEVELGSLLGLTNVLYGPTSSQVTLLTISTFIFVIQLCSW